MLDHPNKNGRSNGHGNGGLVVEDPAEPDVPGPPQGVRLAGNPRGRESRHLRQVLGLCRPRASEIKNPGDFRTRSVAGRPVIFCRDRKGEVRALFNVCRHRGALVCREREGNTRQFQCIYHGWTYNTDGSIKGIPGDDAYPPGYDKQGKA